MHPFQQALSPDSRPTVSSLVLDVMVASYLLALSNTTF
jgi:hypothetical protein